MLLPLNKQNMWVYSGYNKEFYKGEQFNNYINEKFNKIYSKVDTDYVYSDQMEELGNLYAEKNIEFMSFNNFAISLDIDICLFIAIPIFIESSSLIDSTVSDKI